MRKHQNAPSAALPIVETYRGLSIERCAYGSHAVRIGARTRFGTLAEIRADIDAHHAGELASAKRGGA